jgi:hypothetical protein
MAEAKPAVRYERTDIRASAIVIAAALIAAGVVFAASAAWLVAERSGTDPGAPNSASGMAIDGVRLQTAAPADLAAFQREKNERLESYGWVDARAGRVHIPVERAMQLMVERRAAAVPAKKGRQ